MEQKHRTILRHYWCDIRDNLEPNNILPKLVLVLGETDEEEIKEQSTRQERCDKLLKILPTRGENAFDVFVNALVKEAPHLAEKLTEADIDTEDEIIKAREQSAKFRAKIRKLKTELEVEKHNRDMKTLKELEKLKSPQGKGKEAKEEETTPDGLQKTETREGGYQRRFREMPRQSENQTREKEIQELIKKSKDYQGESQLQQEDLQLFPRKLEPENKGQQQKNGQSQRKYKEPEDKVTNRSSELKELLAEIIQQHREDASCSHCVILRNERDSTMTEIQTLREEIQKLDEGITKILKYCQSNTQTPHKWHQSPQEKPGNLPHEHKPVNKKHQEEIKDLQKKNNKRLEDLEKSKEKLEKDLLKSQKDLEKLKKDFACENERVKEYQQKLEKESKAKDYLLEQKSKDETQMKEENSSLKEKLKEEISTLDNLKKEVHRLRLTPKEMKGRRWFLLLLPHCRPGLDSKIWILLWIFSSCPKMIER
ncbi:interaptin-like isoform X1 [Acropora muricata]|uniref:interaptin-like isoform X1 n=1 Tax=Acropora muricata TaxID=159855 RepID=UPI0034E5B873